MSGGFYIKLLTNKRIDDKMVVGNNITIRMKIEDLIDIAVIQLNYFYYELNISADDN